MTDLEVLERIQRRVLWLSAWMVHAANARPAVDGLKVGGHQASSSSVVSLLTALYFQALRPDDVVAVKAHASPAFYGAADLERLRVFGGLQAYPSRRKNPEIVDLSTGSMGLGAVAATFGGLATRYLVDHGGAAAPARFVVMVGDAELDEGNVWEMLGEEVVRKLGNVLWIVDVNRQSLDRVTADARPRQLAEMFRAAGWRVDELRWGRALRARFAQPGGERLQARLEAMSNKELLQHITRDAVTLAKKEVELAKAELKADLKAEIGMAKGLGVAGLCAIWAVSLILVAAALALGLVMPAWVAALLVAAAVLIVGGIAGMVGWGKRVKDPLETTRRTLKEDVRWAKERIA